MQPFNKSTHVCSECRHIIVMRTSYWCGKDRWWMSAVSDKNSEDDIFCEFFKIIAYYRDWDHNRTEDYELGLFEGSWC